MTTLGDMKTELFRHIGKPSDDSNASAILTRAINIGLHLVASAYEPHEANKAVTGYIELSYAAGVSPIGNGISIMPRFSRLRRLYNSTDDIRMWPLNLDDWDTLHVPDNGIPEYYCITGPEIYTAPNATVQTTLYLYYIEYPEYITSSWSTVIFDRYHPLIMQMATEWYWATQEEPESSELWSKIGSKFGIKTVDIERARAAISKEVV